MTVTRTPTIETDAEFEAYASITKSHVDTATGKRYITGVATGVAEDRDGERCSVNCVKSMGQQIARGGVRVTSSHQQDWMTEIGDVVKGTYDPDTDELVIVGELPPEGVDPIADKAFRVANTEKVGWSVGGKLLKSFFERNEVGKKRKVLDHIALRHVMLTKNPAYQHSFAEAVAKSYDGGEPADEEFTLDAAPEVAKDATGSWVSGGSDGGGGNVGRDSVGSGKRNAGANKDGGPMKTDDTSEDDSDTDGDDGKDLPKAPDQRHLSCPNCGHEFAADLPVDPNERQPDNNDSGQQTEDPDAADTGKSMTKVEDAVSTLSDTVDTLKRLATNGEDVGKSTDPADTAAPDPAEPQVAKTDAEPTDVEKMVATSHKLMGDRLDNIEKQAGEAFELIAKSLKQLHDTVGALPQGRKSIARTLPPSTGHTEGTVEKTVDELVDEAPDALSALKTLNSAAGWTK